MNIDKTISTPCPLVKHWIGTMGATGAKGFAPAASSSPEVTLSASSVRRASRDRRMAYQRLRVAISNVAIANYLRGTLLPILFKTPIEEHPSVADKSSCKRLIDSYLDRPLRHLQVSNFLLNFRSTRVPGLILIPCGDDCMQFFFGHLFLARHAFEVSFFFFGFLFYWFYVLNRQMFFDSRTSLGFYFGNAFVDMLCRTAAIVFNLGSTEFNIHAFYLLDILNRHIFFDNRTSLENAFVKLFCRTAAIVFNLGSTEFNIYVFNLLFASLRPISVLARQKSSRRLF